MSEKKKLNLDRPILSVRKYSSIKLDRTKIDNPTSIDHPVKIAGEVPFLWEKSPGKARENEEDKNKRERKSCDSNDRAFADALNTLSRIEYIILLNGCRENARKKNEESGSNRVTFEQLLGDPCDKANNTQSLKINSNTQLLSERESSSKNVEKQCEFFVNGTPPLLKSPSDSWLGRILSANNVGGSNKKPDG